LAILVFTTIFTTCSDEIGVAKFTNRIVAILLPPSPEIATGKTTKHRWSSSVETFALKSVENFFDLVHES
jgi:hypothetical protein